MINVFFIGTGGGAPSVRGLPAYLVRKEGINVLLDCGEGTQITMIRHGINIMSIKVIAITHLHADHVLGLPPLIQTLSMYGRKEKLYILGDVKKLLEESFEDTHFSPTFEINYVNSYQDTSIKITPFPTCHVIKSQGYIIEEKERINVDAERLKKEGITDWKILRSLKEGKEVEYEGKKLIPEDYVIKKKGLKIAYTGDTAICERVISAVSSSDLLLHDSTFTMDINASDYGHSTASDAAEVAINSGVKRLGLIHISGRYKSAEPLLEEAMKKFPKSFVPNDLSYIILH
ncbi:MULTISPECIES: ribonuclease Z [Acidianus]|uniref:Ribonuclease Z n=1 Tax=Candidatus Acidianus copahuensis TaxID=1160895 RepID=A0A031LMR9_9CREN|nr:MULTISPECIES: ribonuclease Z [Acidianus]EZQ06933.1 ribonuclease Z [Candidatus Acidianus copahuensis]NON62174.1 ribonuclease Z [Acidianus sp. RZ1]